MASSKMDRLLNGESFTLLRSDMKYSFCPIYSYKKGEIASLGDYLIRGVIGPKPSDILCDHKFFCSAKANPRDTKIELGITGVIKNHTEHIHAKDIVFISDLSASNFHTTNI